MGKLGFPRDLPGPGIKVLQLPKRAQLPSSTLQLILYRILSLSQCRFVLKMFSGFSTDPGAEVSTPTTLAQLLSQHPPWAQPTTLTSALDLNSAGALMVTGAMVAGAMATGAAVTGAAVTGTMATGVRRRG